MSSSSAIAITSGDPCGIGPEVILKALMDLPPSAQRRMVVIGDHAVFERTAKRLRRRLPSWTRLHVKQSIASVVSPLTFLDCGHRDTFVAGRSSREAGAASLAYLDLAITLAQTRRVGAIVTAPVTKWAINRSHPRFIGQTEYLAKAFGVRDVVMMFVSDRLRVVLLTRHIPIHDVASSVDQRLLRVTLRLTHEALRRTFHIAHPTLAICGLNPHAGEKGMFGSEEKTILLPVLRQLRRGGLICEGPFAADGLFAQPSSSDAVICWYHDQGLIPFKMAARDRGCQLSLGLPTIRTSPDHGSALEIAGHARANPGSMRYALRLAANLTKRSARS